MCHARYDGCCRIVVDITELLTDGQTDGRTDRRMEKWAPMSQSQEVREMFHARFDGCLVL